LKSPIPNFIEILQVGAALKTCGQTERPRATTNLIGALREYENVPEKCKAGFKKRRKEERDKQK